MFLSRFWGNLVSIRPGLNAKGRSFNPLIEFSFSTDENNIWYSLYYIVASKSMILATTARLQYVLSSKAAMPSFYTAT